MKTLSILVDHDNIQPQHRAQGPMKLARMLLGVLPANLLHPYDKVEVRLYGGWRSATGLTAEAQAMSPEIQRESPMTWPVTLVGERKSLVVDVRLAMTLQGTRQHSQETYVRNRPLRHFKAVSRPWPNCTQHATCGFAMLEQAHKTMPCNVEGCFAQLGDLLVHNEQKMVDTLLVADIAYEIFIRNVEEVVVVSSDVDMWPGIQLALQGGRRVTHVHTTQGYVTQPNLTSALLHPMAQNYRQLSV